MPHLYLYSAPDCHLCEQAAALISACCEGTSTLEHKDITGDKSLLVKYRLKIPVLANANNKNELCWPFDEQELENYLAELRD